MDEARERILTSKRMCPKVDPLKVAAFFRATEIHCQPLEETEMPVYRPRFRAPYCKIEIDTINGDNWRFGRRLNRHNENNRLLGYYIIVDITSVRSICYVSSTGHKVTFVRDMEDGLFLAVTDLTGMGPIIEKRLSDQIAPIEQWRPY